MKELLKKQSTFLLYGFRSQVALKYLPWEDETPEEFKERSKMFGLK
jgi:hypothetical protein